MNPCWNADKKTFYRPAPGSVHGMPESTAPQSWKSYIILPSLFRVTCVLKRENSLFLFPEINFRRGDCSKIEQDVRHMKMNHVLSGGGCVPSTLAWRWRWRQQFRWYKMYRPAAANHSHVPEGNKHNEKQRSEHTLSESVWSEALDAFKVGKRGLVVKVRGWVRDHVYETSSQQ